MDELPLPTISQKLGDSLPFGDNHAVSVCLPTWDATMGWATRDKAILDVMKTGYPRFFIHQIIDRLAGKFAKRFGDEKSKSHAILFSCNRYAAQCKAFLLMKATASQTATIKSIVLADKQSHVGPWPYNIAWYNARIHVVIYPLDMMPIAKVFWQHTGFGISSRYAEFLSEIEEQGYLDIPTQDNARSPCTNGPSAYMAPSSMDHTRTAISMRANDLKVKRTLSDRIAKLACPAHYDPSTLEVYLFPSGMAAISATAEIVKSFNSTDPIVVYGFLYLDTFKVLSKIYNFKTILYGQSTASELDDLETKLQSGRRISALYCEFPGNPLLRTPDLQRLHDLAHKHNFLLICDDTIGTSTNVALLPHVDILVTSLTKIFSGGCNVMGGSLILNPHSQHSTILSASLQQTHIDTYFPEDAKVMERNSRNLESRIRRVNTTTNHLLTLLSSHPSVHRLHHPTTNDTLPFYEAFRKRPHGGYGYLLSVVFDTPANAQRFYDHLHVAKGPSLGTDFTLACAYTLFAHYGEREWAARYGVVEHLVRISVGVEEEGWLLRRVGKALEKVVVAGGKEGRGEGRGEEAAGMEKEGEGKEGELKLGGKEWEEEVLAKEGI